MDAGCSQAFQPGHQRFEATGFAMDVHVQAVLSGLAFGHVLEEYPSPMPDAAGLVEWVTGTTDRGVAAEGPVAVVLTTASWSIWPAAYRRSMRGLGSATWYSSAAAQKSARSGAFVVSTTSFQLSAMPLAKLPAYALVRNESLTLSSPAGHTRDGLVTLNRRTR